jgi:hypothetical protein
MTAATVVSVQNTPDTYYTWAGCAWAWTDARAQKSWSTSYDSTFTVSATEGWTNADSLGNATKKSLSEGFATAYADYRKFTKNPVETLHTGELLVRQMVHQIAEAVKSVEVYGNHPSLALSDAFTASEVGVTRDFTKNPVEPITVAEQLARSQDFHIYDAFGIEDQLGNHLSKAVSDFFSATDAYLTQFGKSIPESWKTAEHYSDLMAWILRSIESIHTSESLGNRVMLPKAESFTASEVGVTKDYELSPKTNIHADELLSRSIVHQLQEAIATLEKYGQDVTIPVAEQFSTDEFLVKSATMSIDEAVHTAEVFGRTVYYLRTLSEGFKSAEALGLATTISQSEALSVMEEYRRHGNGVVSNLAIKSDTIALADFENLILASSPPGYSDFKTFITGTYTYQKALMRAVVRSFTLDRAIIKDLSTTVDVPDVNDSGEAVITTASTGVAVTYNRKFHVTPEVTLTLKGGSDVLAVPQFSVAPTTTGFTVVLADASTGTKVTGTISWAAHGY